MSGSGSIQPIDDWLAVSPDSTSTFTPRFTALLLPVTRLTAEAEQNA